MNNIMLTAIKAALLAGKEILTIYNGPYDFEVEKKSDSSPLTIADRKAHIIINDCLQETNLPILSEEGKEISFSEREKWESFWLVDPLDGTKEFIKKNDEFTVNIALIENNKTIGGVIYVPVSGNLYFGMVGVGAFLKESVFSLNNDFDTIEQLIQSSISLPKNRTEKKVIIIASRSHLNDETKDFITEVKQKLGEIESVSKGSSLKLCMIAEGKADIYPRFAPTMEWDIAAGHAIIKAAGHIVVRSDTKKEVIYNKENLLNPWFLASTTEFFSRYFNK